MTSAVRTTMPLQPTSKFHLGYFGNPFLVLMIGIAAASLSLSGFAKFTALDINQTKSELNTIHWQYSKQTLWFNYLLILMLQILFKIQFQSFISMTFRGTFQINNICYYWQCIILSSTNKHTVRTF